MKSWENLDRKCPKERRNSLFYANFNFQKVLKNATYFENYRL